MANNATSNTNFTMTTGVVAQNNEESSTHNKGLVSIRTAPIMQPVDMAGEYRYVVSNRKIAARLHLDTGEKTFGFDIFDDVKCFPGQQVTIIQDGKVVIHVINHTTKIKVYVGPEKLHQHYTTQGNTGATVESLFTQFKTQMTAIVLGSCMAMAAQQAGYNVLLKELTLSNELLMPNNWLVSIAVWLMITLMSAQLMIKNSSLPGSLKNKCQPQNRRQANYFCMTMSWTYPVLSLLVLTHSITMTKAVLISTATLLMFALVNYLLVIRKSNAQAMGNAQHYEKSIDCYFARNIEKQKERFMQLKAA